MQMNLSIYVPIHLSIYKPSIYLSIYLSTELSISNKYVYIYKCVCDTIERKGVYHVSICLDNFTYLSAVLIHILYSTQTFRRGGGRFSQGSVYIGDFADGSVIADSSGVSSGQDKRSKFWSWEIVM